MPVISRAALEENQVGICFAAVLVGLLAAVSAPGDAWSVAINPVLAALLYVTFLQVPLADLRRGLANGRFMSALLVVNFAVVPCVAFGLVSLLPSEQWAVRLGALMVLLTPCIDYVVVFTGLGRGDARLVLATQILRVAQMLLLPLHLGLFVGGEAVALMQLMALVLLVVIAAVAGRPSRGGGSRSRGACLCSLLADHARRQQGGGEYSHRLRSEYGLPRHWADSGVERQIRYPLRRCKRNNKTSDTSSRLMAEPGRKRPVRFPAEQLGKWPRELGMEVLAKLFSVEALATWMRAIFGWR